MALFGVVDLQPFRSAGERHIELALAGVDAGADHAMLAHLRRPFLVMRTLGSFNHPGPMKSRSRSCSGTAQKAAVRTIRRSAARPGWPPGSGRSSRNDPKYRFALIQGARPKAEPRRTTARLLQHRGRTSFEALAALGHLRMTAEGASRCKTSETGRTRGNVRPRQ